MRTETLIGRTLAHYRISAAIGAGGMGEVYRATDTKLNRDVALKVLPAEMTDRTDRGRDAGFPAPPAQIRACRTSALGSCLRC